MIRRSARNSSSRLPSVAATVDGGAVSPSWTTLTGGSCFLPAITTPPLEHQPCLGGEHCSRRAPCEDSTDHATRHETAEQYGQATPAVHARQRQGQQARRTVGTSTRHAHRWRAESECQRS